MKKEEIIEVLKKHSIFTDGGNVKKELAVFEEQFYYVANDILKLKQESSLLKESDESLNKKVRTTEEILKKHGIIHKPKSEYDYYIFTETFSKYDVIQAMQEYASQFQQKAQPSDEDIEEWAKIDDNDPKFYLRGGTITGRIYGAKAMRDGKIKTN